MLLKKTFLYLPSQILGPLSQLVSILIWTHLADANTIGFVTLVSTQQELIRTIGLFWWSHFILRFIGEYRSNEEISTLESTSNAIISVSLIIQAVLSCILVLVIIDDNTSSTMLLCVALFVVFRSFNQHHALIATVKDKILDYTVLSLSGPCLGLLIGVYFLFSYGSDPIWPLLGFVLGEMVGSVYFLIRTKFIIQRSKISKQVSLKGLKYGLPIVVSGALAWFSLNISRYIVEMHAGLAAAGEFAVGYGLGQRASSLAAMLVTIAALPLAIKKIQEGTRQQALLQLSDNCALMLGVMGPCLLGIYLISDLVIPLVVAEEFVVSTLSILPWALLSGGLFSFASHYLNHLFYLDKKPGQLAWIDLSFALVITCVCFYFIKNYNVEVGMKFMVLSQFLIILLLLTFLILKRGLVFPLKNATKVSLAMVCMAISVNYILLDDIMITLALKIIIGLLVYLLILLVLFYRGFREVYISRGLSVE